MLFAHQTDVYAHSIATCVQAFYFIPQRCGISELMQNPEFAAARAQGRYGVGRFYSSAAAQQMDTAIRKRTGNTISLFDAANSGYEEGFDGVEVFQKVAYSMFIGLFRWV